jgi:hypothetical protein
MVVCYIISIIITIIALMWAVINHSYGADAPYIISGEFTVAFIIFVISFVHRQLVIRKYREKHYKTDPNFYNDRTD